MRQVTLMYFASLRDCAGVEQETLDTTAEDLPALYAQTATRHGFSLPRAQVRVAVDGAFVPWDTPLREGSSIAFIPPVSGG